MIDLVEDVEGAIVTAPEEKNARLGQEFRPEAPGGTGVGGGGCGGCSGGGARAGGPPAAASTHASSSSASAAAGNRSSALAVDEGMEMEASLGPGAVAASDVLGAQLRRARTLEDTRAILSRMCEM